MRKSGTKVDVLEEKVWRFDFHENYEESPRGDPRVLLVTVTAYKESCGRKDRERRRKPKTFQEPVLGSPMTVTDERMEDVMELWVFEVIKVKTCVLKF